MKNKITPVPIHPTGKFTEEQLKNGLTVLSLFDGMGGVWEVLQDMGIPIKKAYSSEIDKFANIANHHAHPYVEALGDVRDIDVAKLGKIDLVCGGSPCQGFSFAGKQLKFDDPRSKLFWEFHRIVLEAKKHNPNALFFLENVKMDKRSEAVISRAMNIQPIFINSALVSAQNRQRLYWTDMGTKHNGNNLFAFPEPGIPQPEDRGIILRDVLQPLDEVDGKYFLSEKSVARMLRKQERGKFGGPRIFPDKAGPIMTGNNSAKESFDSGTALIPYEIDQNGYLKLDLNGRAKANQQKASCFTAGAHSGGNHSDMDVFAFAIRGRTDKNGTTVGNPEPRTDGKKRPQQHRVYLLNGVSPALCAGIAGVKIVDDRPLGCLKFGRTDEAKAIRKANMANGFDHTPFQGRQIEGIDFEKTNTLTTAITKDTILADAHFVIFRRLTPIECCRLQGVRDGFFIGPDGVYIVSETQMYKMLGNGWQLDTIKYIFSFALPN